MKCGSDPSVLRSYSLRSYNVASLLTGPRRHRTLAWRSGARKIEGSRLPCRAERRLRVVSSLLYRTVRFGRTTKNEFPTQAMAAVKRLSHSTDRDEQLRGADMPRSMRELTQKCVAMCSSLLCAELRLIQCARPVDRPSSSINYAVSNLRSLAALFHFSQTPIELMESW